jgi:CubicO group peptidase (beta-lactamase class C family)
MEHIAFDRYLTTQSQHGLFHGAVLVRQNGATLLDRGYGAADRGRPNSPETAFQIASISKQFTAAAILLLQEGGRSLSRTASRPGYPTAPRRGSRSRCTTY